MKLVLLYGNSDFEFVFIWGNNSVKYTCIRFGNRLENVANVNNNDSDS
jgi:hypothetical protein